MRFVIDEDMPRSLGSALRAGGHEALDVRDDQLRGAADERILQFAVEMGAALITEDLGFANLLRFPLGSHSGIVVARFPTSLSPDVVVAAVTRAMEPMKPSDVQGTLVILEPGRTRIRSTRR